VGQILLFLLLSLISHCPMFISSFRNKATRIDYRGQWYSISYLRAHQSAGRLRWAQSPSSMDDHRTNNTRRPAPAAPARWLDGGRTVCDSEPCRVMVCNGVTAPTIDPGTEDDQKKSATQTQWMYSKALSSLKTDLWGSELSLDTFTVIEHYRCSNKTSMASRWYSCL